MAVGGDVVVGDGTERGPSGGGARRRTDAPPVTATGAPGYVFARPARLTGTALVVLAGVAASAGLLAWRPATITLRGPCLGVAAAMLPAVVLTAIARDRSGDGVIHDFWGWWLAGCVALVLTEAAFGLGVDPADGHVAPYVIVGVVATSVLANVALLTLLRVVVERSTVRVDVLTGLVGTVVLWACTSILLAELGPQRAAPSAWLLGAAVATAPGTVYVGSRVFRSSDPALAQTIRFARGLAIGLFGYLVVAGVGIVADWPEFEPMSAPLVALAVSSMILMPLWHRNTTPPSTAGPLHGATRRHPALVVAPVVALAVLTTWVWQRPDANRVAGPLAGYLVATCVLLAVQGVFTSRESELLRRDLHHLATHDELTGLWNRRQGELLLATALDTLVGRGPGVAVITVDLDGFKAVNDRHGHPAGDRLLREVAAALQAKLRRGDSVCRYGGDEFVVVCRDLVDRDEARAAAERVVASLRGLTLPEVTEAGLPSPDRFGASAGVIFVNSWVPPSVALAAADEALLRAKREGRGRVALGDVVSSR